MMVRRERYKTKAGRIEASKGGGGGRRRKRRNKHPLGAFLWWGSLACSLCLQLLCLFSPPFPPLSSRRDQRMPACLSSHPPPTSPPKTKPNQTKSHPILLRTAAFSLFPLLHLTASFATAASASPKLNLCFLLHTICNLSIRSAAHSIRFRCRSAACAPPQFNRSPATDQLQANRLIFFSHGIHTPAGPHQAPSLESNRIVQFPI